MSLIIGIFEAAKRKIQWKAENHKAEFLKGRIQKAEKLMRLNTHNAENSLSQKYDRYFLI